MRPTLVLYLTITAAVAGAGTDPPACPDSWLQTVDGYCFWTSPFVVQWHEMEAVCELASPYSRPASVHSQVQNSVLGSLLQAQPAWLGLHGDGTTFSWMDGTSVDFAYWDRHQPRSGHHCAVINFNNVTGQWGSAHCDEKEYSVTCRQKAVVCPDDWAAFGRKCYHYSSVSVTFSQVDAECDRLHTGATSVSIHSDKLNSFLASLRSSSAWIGLSRINSNASFQWADGSEVDYVDWYESYKPEDSVYMGSRGQWWTAEASDSNRFLCEFSI